MPKQFFIGTQHHLIAFRSDLLHIIGGRRRNAKPSALPYRIMNDAFMPSYDLPVLRHKIPRRHRFSCILFNKLFIVPVRYKTDILTVLLPGIVKTVLLRQFPHPVLCQFPQRETDMG